MHFFLLPKKPIDFPMALIPISVENMYAGFVLKFRYFLQENMKHYYKFNHMFISWNCPERFVLYFSLAIFTISFEKCGDLLSTRGIGKLFQPRTK